MITTHDAAFHEEEGYEILGDLIEWRRMSQAELADVARRYAVARELFVEPDKRPVVVEPDYAAEIFG